MKMINKLWRNGINSLSVALAIMLLTSVGFAQTLGGTVIPNRASANYRFMGIDQNPSQSNEVNSEIPKHCFVQVTPDGDSGNPAYFKQAFPNDTLYFAYHLTNTGNIANDFSVAAVLESGTDLGVYSVILDSNNNGIFDAGEPEITELSNVAIGETINLLLKVAVSSNYSANGSAFVDLVASCLTNGNSSDTGNVAEIGVPLGGISDLSKSAKPASGTNVLPGEAISYSISFTVNKRDLSSVSISDKLSSWLTAPKLTLTVNGQERENVAKFNESNNMITANLGALDAGSRVVMMVETSLREDTPGNEIISNKASVSFDGGSETSNEVKHPVLAFCSVDLNPNGTVAKPAYKSRVLPGGKAVYAYEISNTSNMTNTYNLAVNVHKQSDLEPLKSYIVIDANANGKVDAGEKEITSISLAMAETAKLLMVLEISDEYDISGDIFATPSASCDGSLPVPPGKKGKDADNIARTTIPLGGFAAPEKKSNFAVDKPLYPNAKLSYTITFTANDRDLSNVVISDVISEAFGTPSNITQGAITDSSTGLETNATASYDSSSRTITWRFIKVPATMTVSVSFDVVVRSDVKIAPNSTITNIAKIKADNVGNKPTNPVTHKLKPINIVIEKTVDRKEISVGQELEYTLKITNPKNSVGLDKLVVTDELPKVLKYVAKTSRVTKPDGAVVEIEPTVKDNKLTWDLDGIEPGQIVLIKFKTLVLPTAMNEKEIINIATAIASDSTSKAESKSESTVATVVQLGIFKAKSVLLGTVYTDVNDNDVYDQDVDLPQEAARIYLSDGKSILTDEFGRYSFVNMNAGIETVKIDNTSIPARLLKETISEMSPGQWLVRLEPGLITRLDIPLLDPKADISVAQTVNLVMGPVSLTKTISIKDGVAYVAINVSSSQSLRGLKLNDSMPADAKLISVSTAAENGLEFNLGDIEAGFSSHIEYQLELAESNSGLYKAPAITWSVR